MNTRGFISFLTFLGFFLLTVTGIIIYIVPQGRIAYWMDWRFLSLTKDDWMNIHILSGVLFILAGAFHIYYNWKPLVHYVVDKARSGGVRLKKELALSVMIGVLIIASAIFQLPPLKYVIDLNAYIKDSWIKDETFEPPFGHAELVPLNKFLWKMNIDFTEAMNEFDSHGIKIAGQEDTLEDIAIANNTSPRHLYELIKKYEKGKRPGMGHGQRSGRD